jgi:hypothetical protein
MSETFLSRWSRRKRAASTSPRERINEATDREAGSIPPAPLGGEGGEDRRSEPSGGDYSRSELAQSPPTPDPSPPRFARGEGNREVSATEGKEATFDPASLPPLESIEAGTDVSAFLRPGVPADLARAALRRAWVADPTIRDFVGLAENAWDFTAPGGVPGFEPLRAIDDVARLAAQVAGALPAVTPELPGGEQIEADPPETEAAPQQTRSAAASDVAPSPVSDASAQKENPTQDSKSSSP